ncbi:glycosyltransferase [Patescibacteria group bacterium]|nr:glycosyltransferase [Patescibacteria group bacterium]
MDSSTTKPTVFIGIPAYNEEANIHSLLTKLFSQIEDGFNISRIVVNSDGSSDRTKEEVEKIKDSRLILKDNKDRKGQAGRQNEMIDMCAEDILVLLNADILITSDTFIRDIVLPVINDGADIVSSCMLATTPKGYLESVLVLGMDIKTALFETYADGENVYTCHGAARAFSRRFYKSFKFGASVGEDAHSYYFAKHNGFNYYYAKDAVCYIRCPSNLKDHINQSVRFFKAKAESMSLDVVLPEIKFLTLNSAWLLLPFLFRKPVKTTLYAFIVFYTILITKTRKQNSQVWQVSTSSKVLN